LCARAFTPGAANMRRKSFLSNRTRESNSAKSSHRATGNNEFLARIDGAQAVV
jgi:hypothetical protein